ncbi:MAG: hypothetical protein VW268_06650 [Rhodospirillaceae bacterium]
MATAPDPQKSLPTQENLLLDYVRRLEDHRDGRGAVHVHLSQLRPFNRREQHIRAATSSFDPLVSSMDGQLFALRNADLMFIFKSDAKPQVETIVQKVRFLFSDDPLIVEAKSHGRPLATWYDAETAYDDILLLSQGLADEEEERQTKVRSHMDARSSLKAKQKQGEPLTPDVLARVEVALGRTDLSNFVRRQFVCRVDSKLVPAQEFSELFISINDLRETLMPGVNLTSNRWLFHHLTETLDKRMLSMLLKNDAVSISGEISFNANVKTLLSDEFQSFDSNISASRRGAMVIELQKEDIFSDLPAFLIAREFVQERGYRVLLDGLTMQTLAMIDREKLGCDLAKLIWAPALADAGEDMRVRLEGIAAQGGGGRIIMCRCDTREAVEYGRSVGINRFQGRFVETLIAEDGRRRDLLKLKHRIQRGDARDYEDKEEYVE